MKVKNQFWNPDQMIQLLVLFFPPRMQLFRGAWALLTGITWRFSARLPLGPVGMLKIKELTIKTNVDTLGKPHASFCFSLMCKQVVDPITQSYDLFLGDLEGRPTQPYYDAILSLPEIMEVARMNGYPEQAILCVKPEETIFLSGLFYTPAASYVAKKSVQRNQKTNRFYILIDVSAEEPKPHLSCLDKNKCPPSWC